MTIQQKQSTSVWALVAGITMLVGLAFTVLTKGEEIGTIKSTVNSLAVRTTNLETEAKIKAEVLTELKNDVKWLVENEKRKNHTDEPN